MCGCVVIVTHRPYIRPIETIWSLPVTISHRFNQPVTEVTNTHTHTVLRWENEKQQNDRRMNMYLDIGKEKRRKRKRKIDIDRLMKWTAYKRCGDKRLSECARSQKPFVDHLTNTVYIYTMYLDCYAALTLLNGGVSVCVLWSRVYDVLCQSKNIITSYSHPLIRLMFTHSKWLS